MFSVLCAIFKQYRLNKESCSHTSILWFAPSDVPMACYMLQLFPLFFLFRLYFYGASYSKSNSEKLDVTFWILNISNTDILSSSFMLSSFIKFFRIIILGYFIKFYDFSLSVFFTYIYWFWVKFSLLLYVTCILSRETIIVYT